MELTAFGPIFLYFKIRIEKREYSKKAIQENDVDSKGIGRNNCW
jgi:hypothetical protein